MASDGERLLAGLCCLIVSVLLLGFCGGCASAPEVVPETPEEHVHAYTYLGNETQDQPCAIRNDKGDVLDSGEQPVLSQVYRCSCGYTRWIVLSRGVCR